MRSRLPDSAVVRVERVGHQFNASNGISVALDIAGAEQGDLVREVRDEDLHRVGFPGCRISHSRYAHHDPLTDAERLHTNVDSLAADTHLVEEAGHGARRSSDGKDGTQYDE